MRNDGSCAEVVVPLLGAELRLAQDTARMDHAYSVWDASVVLAKYLERNRAWARRQLGPPLEGADGAGEGAWLLELGAGCGGLLSLAAALLLADAAGAAGRGAALSIVATDLETTLPLLRRNIDVNVGAARVNQGIAPVAVHTAALDWTKQVRR